MKHFDAQLFQQEIHQSFAKTLINRIIEFMQEYLCIMVK